MSTICTDFIRVLKRGGRGEGTLGTLVTLGTLLSLTILMATVSVAMFLTRSAGRLVRAVRRAERSGSHALRGNQREWVGNKNAPDAIHLLHQARSLGS